MLEPFAGSGSTLGACKAIGYDALGVELDDEYFAALPENIDNFARLYPSFKGTTLTMEANVENTKPIKFAKPKSKQKLLL